MKNVVHVEKFAELFTITTNRLGNESLALDANMESIMAFLAGQVMRDGDGEQSTVDAEIEEILRTHFTGKVSDLDPVENSEALIKRVNGWNKRPEKAATSEETKANKSQVKGTNELALALAAAQEEYSEDSDEVKEAKNALMEFALANVGK